MAISVDVVPQLDETAGTAIAAEIRELANARRFRDK